MRPSASSVLRALSAPDDEEEPRPAADDSSLCRERLDAMDVGGEEEHRDDEADEGGDIDEDDVIDFDCRGVVRFGAGIGAAAFTESE